MDQLEYLRQECRDLAAESLTNAAAAKLRADRIMELERERDELAAFADEWKEAFHSIQCCPCGRIAAERDISIPAALAHLKARMRAETMRSVHEYWTTDATGEEILEWCNLEADAAEAEKKAEGK